MRALITGATGLIGRQLIRSIESPVVLSRRPGEARRLLRSVEVHLWELESGSAPYDALSGSEVVLNLAGEPVSEGRWTDKKERRIRDSWVVGTRNHSRLRAAAALPGSRRTQAARGSCTKPYFRLPPRCYNRDVRSEDPGCHRKENKSLN